MNSKETQPGREARIAYLTTVLDTQRHLSTSETQRLSAELHELQADRVQPTPPAMPTPAQIVDRFQVFRADGYGEESAVQQVALELWRVHSSRPPGGVWLTPEERHVIADAIEYDLDRWPVEQREWRRALAARLEEAGDA